MTATDGVRNANSKWLRVRHLTVLPTQEKTGIEELKLTTAHEPDYDKLMKHRIDALRKHNVKISVRRLKLRGTHRDLSPQSFGTMF